MELDYILVLDLSEDPNNSLTTKWYNLFRSLNATPKIYRFVLAILYGQQIKRHQIQPLFRIFVVVVAYFNCFICGDGLWVAFVKFTLLSK